MPSCMQETNEATIVINMDTQRFIDIGIERILDNSTYTTLEFTPESSLSGILWFLQYCDAFYVIDGRQRKLLHFDSQGKFIQKIGEVGAGPNEFVALFDAHVSEKGFSFLVGTSETKIFDYSLGGEFLRSTTFLPEPSYAFGVHPQNGDYFFKGLEHQKPRITKIDPHSSSVIDTFLTMNGFAGFEMDHNFSVSTNDNMLFFTSMDNQVYEITTDTREVKYKLEYRSNYPDYLNINRDSWKDLDTHGYWLIHRILENNDWMYLCISRGSNTQDDLQELYNLVYNIKTQEIFRIPGRWQDQNDFYPAFYLGEDNLLHISMVPVKILDDPIWMEFFNRSGKSPDEDSNPIILKVALDKVFK
jgi:hypothetical protein